MVTVSGELAGDHQLQHPVADLFAAAQLTRSVIQEGDIPEDVLVREVQLEAVHPVSAEPLAVHEAPVPEVAPGLETGVAQRFERNLGLRSVRSHQGDLAGRHLPDVRLELEVVLHLDCPDLLLRDSVGEEDASAGEGLLTIPLLADVEAGSPVLELHDGPAIEAPFRDVDFHHRFRHTAGTPDAPGVVSFHVAGPLVQLDGVAIILYPPRTTAHLVVPVAVLDYSPLEAAPLVIFLVAGHRALELKGIAEAVLVVLQASPYSLHRLQDIVGERSHLHLVPQGTQLP